MSSNGQVSWTISAFRVVLRGGLSDKLTRRFEFGRADQYYGVICRGVGDRDTIDLYSSEQQARRHYEHAVNRHDKDSHWQRV
jgi:hypothetical protein